MLTTGHETRLLYKVCLDFVALELGTTGVVRYRKRICFHIGKGSLPRALLASHVEADE